jgi:hypothetical protein
MAVEIFRPALKQNIFKRQWRIRVIELSALSDGSQQHKSAHISVMSRAREKKI